MQESVKEGLQYMQAGELGMAEEALSSALDLSEREFGETHKITLRCLEYSARAIMLGAKDDEMACAMYERLIDIREGEVGVKNNGGLASMASIYMELSGLYERLGRAEDAEKMASRYEKNFDLFKEKLEEGPLPPIGTTDGDSSSEEDESDEDSEEEGSKDEEEEEGGSRENKQWRL